MQLNEMTMTTFKSRIWIRVFPVLFIVVGTWVLFWTYDDFSTKNDQQVQAAYILTGIIGVVFFALPIAIFICRKAVSNDNGKWTIDYPYQRRTVIIDAAEIDKIEILENISQVSLPTFETLTVTAGKRKITFSSLELGNYGMLKELMTVNSSAHVIIRIFGERWKE